MEVPVNNQITSSQFFTAGHAVFTVGNPKGEHYTFRIQRPKPQTEGPYADRVSPLFVSLLVGPDNTRDYAYMGIFDHSEHRPLRLTQKSKVTYDSRPVKVFGWAVNLVRNGKPVPEGYSIQHEGRCGRCGRALTVPESVQSGFGPECIEYVFPSAEKRAALDAKAAREFKEMKEQDARLEPFLREVRSKRMRPFVYC